MRYTRRLLSLLMSACMLLGSGLLSAPLTANADTGPVTLDVGSGKLMVQVCTDDIIRIRYSPSGVFATKTINTFVEKTQWEPVSYTKTDQGGKLTVTTAKVRVEVEKSTGKVTFYTKDGALLLAEEGRSSNPFTLDGQTVYSITQSFASPDNEFLYGFGNINAAVGLKNININIAQHNTEKRTPMFFSNMGYGILFDITSNGTLSWSNQGKTYSYTGRATDSMDYYFFYGPEADQIIAGYRTVTGTATMLPKSAFGYVQSRNRYGSQQEVLDVVDTFRQKGIPLDTIVVDYYWWSGNFNNIMEWSSQFSDPEWLMEELHKRNVTASISVWPSFQSGSKTYNYVSSLPGFLLKTNSNFGYNYDPSSAINRQRYWQLIYDNVFSKGFDSLWLDACEPETSNWVSNTNGEPTAWGNSRLIGTIYPLLTNQGVYEGQRAVPGNTKRVNTLSRGAVAGIQRYGVQSWSGDIPAGWNQLQQEIRGVLNFSAAGLPYFSTDTGGYFGIDVNDPDSREMFLRWLQFSTFNSIMRVHGSECQKEPWRFGSQYEGYITDYINLRERLIPYIYSLAGQVTQNHYTMVRPLVFDFRTDLTACRVQDQFMFGPALMVCPVYTPGARVRDVYLPAGKWINFWTGETIESAGQTFTVPAPLKQIPLFVRAGSIIPMNPFVQYANEPTEFNEIRVYMGADGSFTLYEDEGDNYNYEQGKFSEIPMTYDEETKTLTIGQRKGSFDGMQQTRTFNIVFVQPDYGTGIDLSKAYQASITYDGTPKSVTFDPDWETPPPSLDPDVLPKPKPAPTPKTPKKAMVGEWSFDEGEGAKVRDTSGSFNHGSVITDQPNVWTQGKSGSAIRYTGGSATVPGTYVEVPHSDSLNMTDEISFSCWVYFNGGGHANIVNKGGNGTNNPGFSLIFFDGVRFQLEIQTPRGANGFTSKTTAISTVMPSRNAWHQVGFTWKSQAAGGDGIVRLYVDGVQTSNDNDPANKFAGPIGTNGSGLRFGRSDITEPNYPNYFNGIIDEAKLFNYALTAQEMAALAQEQSILVSNPIDVKVTPGDGQITLTWTDPAEPNLDHIELSYQAEGSDEVKTVTVAKGTQTYTFKNLTNGQYYHIGLTTVMKDGRTSQGSYVVGIPYPYPAQISHLVTHDNLIYGYVSNYTSEEISGTLTVQVFDLADTSKPVKVSTIPNFTVTGMDMRGFQVDIGEYADNQQVQVSFASAQPKSVARQKVYRAGQGLEELREALLAELEREIDESLYTPESVAAYKAAKEAAQALYDDPNATAEQLSAAIQALKTTLVLLPPYTLGDVDDNGTINTTDARLTLQAAVSKIELDDIQKLAADVNNDGKVTATDARLILQRAVNKIDHF